MNGDDVLDKFILEMLDAKNLSGIDDDAKGYLVSDLKERLEAQINKALIDELSDEKLEEFNKLLDDDSVEATTVQQFVENSGVDTKKIVARTALAFRELYLQTSEERDALKLKLNQKA